MANPEAAAAAARTRAEGGDILSEIDKEVSENNVVLYMKGLPDSPMCGFSARASAILQSYGIPFFAVNILADQEKREGVKVYSKWPTIPQVYIGGEFLGGSDILNEMHESGELAQAIKAAFGQ
ncbi:MAG: Grx4 family monothiol glutaredoxin [Bradymonadaceae bacterium]|nr:Grx4 family monothiol glutaredoxin [Lujinxingiaceae bacterium]